MIEIHSFRIGNIYMFIQMSLVSVAGDGRDVFFFGGGGRAANFLGCKFTAWYFVYPFFWNYTVGWKIVSHPRQDLDVQAYIKMSQNMTSFGQLSRYQFQRSKALYSI